MDHSSELWIIAVIALAVLALAAGRSWSSDRDRRDAKPLTLAIVARKGWAGDWDRLQLLVLALRARARLRREIRPRIAFRAAEKPDLVLQRTREATGQLTLTDVGRSAVARPDLLPAIGVVSLAGRAGPSRLAALIVLHRQVRAYPPPPLTALRPLKASLTQCNGDRYLATRLDALETRLAENCQGLRSAVNRLLAMDGETDLDGALLSLNCGSLALDLAEMGERASLSRILALLDREAARPGRDTAGIFAFGLMRGRLLAKEAERAEDASLREAALRTLAEARAQAEPGSPSALEAGLAMIHCLLAETGPSMSPRSAPSEALAIIATIENEAVCKRDTDRVRLALVKARALYLAGVGRGDVGVVEQALAAIAPPIGEANSPALRSELAECRGRIRTELALRRADSLQARLAVADLQVADAMASPARGVRVALALGRVHGWLYETGRGESDYLAAAHAFRRTLSAAAHGALSSAERHRAALAAARLHLTADDTTPRAETIGEAVAAWEAARASLPPGADVLARVELHRIGALALRKLSRLKDGLERTACLDRAVAAIEAALDGLDAATAASALRGGLLRARGEMLAELASLGAGSAALEKSISSYRHALEDAEGIARADALEGLAQVLTDLAAARGEKPPAAAHDALEEAYGLLVANGAPMRADIVLSSSRRLGPRPANDPL
jgi:hypothetical protein